MDILVKIVPCNVLQKTHLEYPTDYHSKLQEMINRRPSGSFGELDCPNTFPVIEIHAGLDSNDVIRHNTINLEKVSHAIKSTSIETDNFVYANISILKTPMGNITEKLLNENVPIKFGIRGTVSKDSDGSIKNINFISIDVLPRTAD